MSAWIHRCPKGHCAWESRKTGIYCEPCDEHYDRGPYDAREVSFPVSDRRTADA